MLTVTDLTEAATRADAMTAGIAGISSGEASTFRLRAVAGHEPWEPVVVVVPPHRHRIDIDSMGRAPLAKLLGLAAGHRGVAVIGANVGDTPWRLRRHGATWRLDPLGWSLRPHGLTAGELADVGAALEAAGEPPLEVVEAPADPPPTPPTWALMARVLGSVDVVDRAGRPVLFDRAKSLELVIWLAQHGGTATRGGARSALWGLDVSNGSFSNVVSEARRAMARLVPPPEGEDWLARTYGERLPLHAGVVLDADVVAAHLARARTLPDDDAIAELRTAIEYVRGVPYAGASYLWPDAEALPSTLTLLVVNVASELAERCLSTGDVEAVFSATAVGLEVLPGHEELVALRMRAHAAKGDLAAVRGEFASYEQAIVNDPWADGRDRAQAGRAAGGARRPADPHRRRLSRPHLKRSSRVLSARRASPSLAAWATAGSTPSTAARSSTGTRISFCSEPKCSTSRSPTSSGHPRDLGQEAVAAGLEALVEVDAPPRRRPAGAWPPLSGGRGARRSSSAASSARASSRRSSWSSGR